MLGRADAALLNLATSKWDSCATEAVLGAAGGTVTTLLGWPIEHAASAPTPNPLGVLCTGAGFEAAAGRTHADLCSALRTDREILQGLLRGKGCNSVEFSIMASWSILKDLKTCRFHNYHLSAVQLFGSFLSSSELPPPRTCGWNPRRKWILPPTDLRPLWISPAASTVSSSPRPS